MTHSRPDPGKGRATSAVIALVVTAGVALSLLSPSSRADDGDVSATWEPGHPTSFTELECPHPKRQFELVSAPVREGTRAARFSVTPRDVWSNGSVRCLATDYTSAETDGDDFVYTFSLLIPAAGISANLIWELHQSEALYTLPGCGVAPFALHTDGSRLLLRIATGDCVEGKGLSTFEPNIAIPGLDPYPRAQWIDVKIRIRFSESPDGIVELWSRVAGTSWPSAPSVERRGIPTMPFSSSARIRRTALYTQMGLYPGRDNYSGNDTLFLDGYRRTSASSGFSSTASVLAVTLTATLLALVLATAGRRRLRRT